MSHNTLVFSTINFEELPVHVEHHAIPSLRPSAIEEDEDDPRSLLYLFQDNDFEQAATFLAIEQARQEAQARAEALAEEQRRILQQQRTRALAARLEQLLDEDDELVDLLGRRILATNGYQVSDIWQPEQHYHQPRHAVYNYGAHYHPHTHYLGSVSRAASTSRSSYASKPRARDVHATWDEDHREPRIAGYVQASPFVHAAPVIMQGHASRPSKLAQQIPSASTSTSEASQATSRKLPTQAKIAFHPVTGVPMLLIEQSDDAIEAEGEEPEQQPEPDSEEEDGSDAWRVKDDSDLDWLGRELLRRQGGANVWILGTDDSEPARATMQAQASQRTPASAVANSSGTTSAVKEATAPTPTLPTQVEEVDSDHELANDIASALDPDRRNSAASLNSPSHRVAAALAEAALLSPTGSTSADPSGGSGSGKPRRQRAATVMSESEEEELETVGRPVDGDEDAGSLSDRPRKSVKVVDMR